MRITLSGDLGAGKTTVSRLLAEALGYQEHYTGGVFRALAKRSGKSIETFYAEMKHNPDLERSIDKAQEEVLRHSDNIIVQGRIAAFLAPEIQKFRIFLRVDPRKGAERQCARLENRNISVDEMLSRTRQRLTEERERYRTLYPNLPDHLDEKRFDLVIDTTNIPSERVRDMILIELAERRT